MGLCIQILTFHWSATCQNLKSSLDKTGVNIGARSQVNLVLFVWSYFHCYVYSGCGWCIIGDGGLKAHRTLCAAVSSGVKEFPNSGVSIMTGVTYWIVIILLSKKIYGRLSKVSWC